MTARTPAPPSSLLSKINTAHLRKRGRSIIAVVTDVFASDHSDRGPPELQAQPNAQHFVQLLEPRTDALAYAGVMLVQCHCPYSPSSALICRQQAARGSPEAEREAISGRATPPQSTITLRTMQGSEFDGLAKEAKQGGAVLFIPRHIYLRFKARREAEDPGDRECQALGLGGQTNHKSCVSSPAARWGYPDVEVGCYSDAIIWAAQPIKLPAAPP
ncbi:hypothetical protein CISG_02849 [Coccidioides immitis RMSCC 3703]|uniref:Uncharacterized protein n=1 Tax=Coccidioides immitis RMSCC 3703 TaxID=454286 RepID=A0A0J8RD56_COCIT|nr:hypothetical protein CISG_02849 [Coccidioides immitis RMSCC 3703]